MVHRKAAHVESLWKPHPPKQQDFEFSSTKWRFHHPPETSIENIQPTSSNPYWRTRTSLPPGVSHLWHFHHMIQLRYRSQDSICQSPSPRGDESVVEWDREFHCNLFYTICTYNNVYTYIYIYFSLGTHLKMCIHWIVDITVYMEIHKPKDWFLLRDSPHHFGWTSHYIVPFMWAHEIRFWQFLLRSDHWHKGQCLFSNDHKWSYDESPVPFHEFHAIHHLWGNFRTFYRTLAVGIHHLVVALPGLAVWLSQGMMDWYSFPYPVPSRIVVYIEIHMDTRYESSM